MDGKAATFIQKMNTVMLQTNKFIYTQCMQILFAF